jgi:hypothetical protein
MAICKQSGKGCETAQKARNLQMRHLWCQELIDTNDPLHARHADAQTYAKEINTLLDDILNISPPKSGSKGQVFKLWGKSTPERRAQASRATRIEPPAGIQMIPYGFGGSDSPTSRKKRA